MRRASCHIAGPNPSRLRSAVSPVPLTKPEAWHFVPEPAQIPSASPRVRNSELGHQDQCVLSRHPALSTAPASPRKSHIFVSYRSLVENWNNVLLTESALVKLTPAAHLV